MDEGAWVILFAGLVLLSFAFLTLLFWIGWRMTQRSQAVSPYTGVPLRRTTEISYYSAERILRYLYELKQYDNRIFKLGRAACRETGRISKIASLFSIQLKLIGLFCKNGIRANGFLGGV